MAKAEILFLLPQSKAFGNICSIINFKYHNKVCLRQNKNAGILNAGVLFKIKFYIIFLKEELVVAAAASAVAFVVASAAFASSFVVAPSDVAGIAQEK